MNNNCFFPYTKEKGAKNNQQKEKKMKSDKEEIKKEARKSLTAKNNYDVDIQACSSMDCTGLIPATPETEEEMEAYEDIYPYLPRANTGKKDDTKIK
jgi:hypothetical protein